MKLRLMKFMIISDRNVKSTAMGMSSYGQVGDRS